jgi:hypothetical protein
MKYAKYLIFALALAQAQPAADLDQTIRDQVIRSALDTLNQGYVYPEIARTMSDVIAEHRQKGEYDLLSDPNSFALALTRDLQAVSHDRHLHIDYGTDNPVQPFETDPDFGFGKTARLPGNVGYIEVRSFSAADGAAEKTASVMRSLDGSSALIIDLRHSGGG